MNPVSFFFFLLLLYTMYCSFINVCRSMSFCQFLSAEFQLLSHKPMDSFPPFWIKLGVWYVCFTCMFTAYLLTKNVCPDCGMGLLFAGILAFNYHLYSQKSWRLMFWWQTICWHLNMCRVFAILLNVNPSIATSWLKLNRKKMQPDRGLQYNVLCFVAQRKV